MSLISMKLRGGGPIYQQLKEEVIRLACQGILQPGEQLPSVRSLARDLGINPNTVSKAYQELENDGVIYSMGGRGSFIADDILAAEGVREDARERVSQAAEKARRVGVKRTELDEILNRVYRTEPGDPQAEGGKEK